MTLEFMFVSTLSAPLDTRKFSDLLVWLPWLQNVTCTYCCSIKSLDLVCMKQLDKRVNIIPIIAKADTISRNELKEFKQRVSPWGNPL